MAKKKTTETVTEILSNYLPDNRLDLYDVEYVKEGKDWFLRVYIDSVPDDDGERSTFSRISTDDCEKVSKYLSAELDRLDPIEHNYYLEVSSPGIDRELKKDCDFTRFAGEKVVVKLYQAYEGRKKLEGILEGLDNGNIRIKDSQGNSIAIPKAQAAKVKLEIVF